MPSFATLTAVLAFAGAASANPVQLHKRKAFSIPQVERKTFLKNGPAQVANTYRKFGKVVPQHILDAAANGPSDDNNINIAATNGSAPAAPADQYDSLYLTPVTIGNGSEVQLDLDTGSGDLWVFSSLQESSQLTGHEYYQVDPTKEMKNASWRISYGDGSGAAGKVYADKVTVGGVTATSQAVEAAASVSAQFQRDRDTDGLLGLSFGVLNTVKPTPQKTFFDNVLEDLAEPLFAVDLRYHAAGSYDFGFIDESKYTGEITYVEVDTTNGWWEFSASGYTIGDGYEKKATITGIGDTGTTLLYIDADVASAYYAAVEGAEISQLEGGYVFPCYATLPDFSLTVGGVPQVIPGKHINYAPLKSGSPTCFGGIQTNEGIGFSIFGDIFLKSKYVIHEAGETPRIGFAQQEEL